MTNYLDNLINELKNTGERPILNQTIESVSNDLSFAYKFASKYAKNKTILDYGCGGGYGAEYLSRFTNQKVIGFDKDKKTIKLAKNFFKTNKKLYFIYKFPKEKFDLIVTFQVIEHIKDRHNFYKKIKKLLNPGGVVLISTPNKNITSYGLTKPAMVFHEFEFNPQEFKNELTQYFHQIKIFGQIENGMKNKVTKNNYGYLDMVKNYPVKIKITWFISQIEIVRKISRHLPMFIKYLLMGFDKNRSTTKHTLVTDNKLIDNSIVLIAKATLD